jgi:hypothetical protein
MEHQSPLPQLNVLQLTHRFMTQPNQIMNEELVEAISLERANLKKKQTKSDSTKKSYKSHSLPVPELEHSSNFLLKPKDQEEIDNGEEIRASLDLNVKQ